MVVGASAHLHLVLRGGEAGDGRTPRQDHQGVPRNTAELKGEGAVEEHDEHAVDPLKDGGGVLQGETLLAEENSALGSEVKENNVCSAGVRQQTHSLSRPKLLLNPSLLYYVILLIHGVRVLFSTLSQGLHWC